MNKSELDNFQLTILRKKYSNLFQKISEVYDTPAATTALVNRGVAIKIAQCYKPHKGCYLQEREEIANRLSEIKFTVFFTQLYNQKNDKTIFFLLKTPSSFLQSPSSNPDHFIRYVLKKYCELLPSEKLMEIYQKTLPPQITKTQNELRKVILDIASIRGAFSNKLASLFDSKDKKSDVTYAAQLKTIIQNAKHTIIDQAAVKLDMQEFHLTQSVCSRACMR